MFGWYASEVSGRSPVAGPLVRMDRTVVVHNACKHYPSLMPVRPVNDAYL